MSHHRQDNSRPRKCPRVSKWQEKGQKDDDMIAPDGVSRSTDHLERWALITADMPQQPTKRAKSRVIEEEIHERIRRRYYFSKHLWPKTTPDDPEPADERMVIDLTADDDAPEEAPSPATTRKRRRSPSLDRGNSRSHHSTVSYAQTMKRRRSRSPSPRRSAYSAFSTRTYGTRALSTAGSDDDYDYYLSSKWSFPSSDEGDEEMI